MDRIPGLSQVKAFAQVVTGDIEGAKRTTEIFLKECPGVSQVTSVVQLAAGDVEGAKETQKRCLNTVSNAANAIPVIGHAKGLVQHAYGDHEGGNRALNAATRSTVVVASGAAAAVATGGLYRETNKISYAGVPRIVIEPEDAIYHDSYVETMIITDNNRQEAQKNMRDRDQQKPKRSILEAHPGTKFITPEELADIIGSSSGDPNRNPDRKPFKNTPECLRELFSRAWMLLILPNEFMFTLVAQLNSSKDGYFHSFIRHIDEWAQVLPSDVSQVLARLSPILTEIRSVAAANYETRGPRERLERAIEQLSSATSIDVQRALSDMQLSMHRFIQRNITFERYQGRSQNTNGGDRLFFKVETESGTKAMVLCLSNETFYPVAGDSRPGRPVRMLITVYFESWEKFKSHGLLETKKEMQKGPKK